MIRLTIQRKVFLAILILAASLVVVLALVMRWNLGLGFQRYTSAAEFARLDWLISNIEREYAVSGGWDFIHSDPEQAWRRLSRPTPDSPAAPPRGRREFIDPEFRPPPPGPEPTRGDRPTPRERLPDFAPEPPFSAGRPPPMGDPLRVGPRLALVDADGTRLAGNAGSGHVGAERPIIYQGQVVGLLTLEASPTAVQELDAAFIASQTQNILVAGLVALGLSLLAAWLLARHLLAPIRDITDGARRIAEGDLDSRIPVRDDDELGELAYNFNAMAMQLARIEASRRDWIADTSHEFRTPLAVLRAEIEALQDGVRQADAATLARLHRQVRQLANLVDDLRLTLDGEPGLANMKREPFLPLAALAHTVTGFRQRFAAVPIKLDLAGLEGTGRRILGDPDRLTQVFANLMENTLRYTDPGGTLRIRSRVDGSNLVIEFDDTAPAPPPTALPHLFERFFRAEPSRSRALGGSGLGLAICKTLIEGHGGNIAAELSELGGLSVRVALPLDTP
jgi:two-component system sensor histidine kinase BaeS